MKLRGEEVAFIGVLAALIIAAGYIKLTPVVGATTYQFSMGSVAIHIVAILLGPILGGITAFVGSFVGQALTGQGFVFPMFIPATIGAVVTGLIIFSRRKEALSIMTIILIVWYAFPLGREIWFFPYLLIISIGALLLSGNILSNIRSRSSEQYQFALIFFATLCGMLSDQLVGSIIAIPIFNLTSDMYTAVLFIYPVERILLALATAFVAVPVLKALKASSLSLFYKFDEKADVQISEYRDETL